MNGIKLERALACAERAARAAGELMRKNLLSPKRINAATQHDIKLELDVRCQRVIERTLRSLFPEVAVLGEEGTVGDTDARARWVVDPIDGTVNFTYGIPHACVSIALQVQKQGKHKKRLGVAEYETIIGVVLDPFCEEIWTARRGGRAKLNGKVIRVSRRAKLSEAIVAIGFAKERSTVNRMLPTFDRLIHRVRKIRIMGAAALSMVYVASGRMDAYVEYGLRLWDIAAGGLIIECAGGRFWREPVAGKHAYQIVASNGRLGRELEGIARKQSRRGKK